MPGLIFVWCGRILLGSRFIRRCWPEPDGDGAAAVNAPGAKFNLKNKRGFNALHNAHSRAMARE